MASLNKQINKIFQILQTLCVVQLPAELISTVNGVVRMCEEGGGSLARDATPGTDHSVMRAVQIDSHERLFQFATFRVKQFADVVHGQRNSN